MNARGVLVKPRRGHVLRFLDRDAVDVIDFLARFVVAETVWAAGEHAVVGRSIDRRAGGAKRGGLYVLRQLGHFFSLRCCRLVAFAHHHPARIVEHRVAGLIEAARAHIDDAGLAVGILLQPDHLRHRIQRVAGIDGFEEAAIGIAEIGHGVERDIGHGLAEHHVENQQIVERRARIADSAGEGVGRLHGKARPEQAVIERHIAEGHRARGGVANLKAEAEVLEKIAGVGLGDARLAQRCGSFIRSGPAWPFSQNREPNARLRQRETDEDVFSPRDSGWIAKFIPQEDT